MSELFYYLPQSLLASAGVGWYCTLNWAEIVSFHILSVPSFTSVIFERFVLEYSEFSIRVEPICSFNDSSRVVLTLTGPGHVTLDGELHCTTSNVEHFNSLCFTLIFPKLLPASDWSLNIKDFKIYGKLGSSPLLEFTWIIWASISWLPWRGMRIVALSHRSS
jgi:hypothetical protein